MMYQVKVEATVTYFCDKNFEIVADSVQEAMALALLQAKELDPPQVPNVEFNPSGFSGDWSGGLEGPPLEYNVVYVEGVK
tara:strand:+ start:1117 stop:1356 length:240 start_codon:yes stop_codon:yes gene_type:complete